MKKTGSIIEFIKKEKVLAIAAALAVISMFFIHPNAEYAGYVNYRVLAILFCLMLVVKGFQGCCSASQSAIGSCSIFVCCMVSPV